MPGAALGGTWFRLAKILLAAALAGAYAGCGPPRRSGPPDLILISIDTLRPDHLGAYGYPRGTTPHLDRLARDSVRFEVAISQAPSTLPSHASMLSSLVPSLHRANRLRGQGLPDEVLTVAEVLRDAGYRTAAFVGGGQVAPFYKLDQGFEVYQSSQGTLRKRARLAADWLDAERPEGPVFLFLHTYEVHHPYRPEPEHMDPLDVGYQGSLPDHIEVDLLRRIDRQPGHEPLEIDAADLQHVVNAYDAGIAHMDGGIRSLVEKLRERGRYEDAAIVFTSDHGEEFGEHGRVGWHSHSLHDHQIRVPLLLKLPRGAHAGSVVHAQVRSIDIAPTLLELAGLPVQASFQGRSLFARLGPDADESPWPARSEQESATDPLPVALRDGRYKWYEGRLFDLATDPGEQIDRSVELPQVAGRLEAALQADAAGTPAAAVDAPVEVPEETRERLRELGYLE